jgi:hypothetical protein
VAFNSKFLACIGSYMGQQQFLYQTTDTLATVDTAGYFNGAADYLRVGDAITVYVVDVPGAPGSVTAYGTTVVRSNSGSAVDCFDVTAGSVTNTR